MTDFTKAAIWIGVFLIVIFMPIFFLLIFPLPVGREFWRELSVGLGFAGLALMGVQFIPTARLPFVAGLLPMDTMYAFHHKASIAGFAMAVAHPTILFIGNPYTLRLLDLTSAPWRARAAVISVIFFILIVFSSVWRKDLKMRYESWRTIHDIFAVVSTALVYYHMFKVNHHMAHPVQRTYWIIMAVIWVASILYLRVIKPLQMIRRPYRVAEVHRELGNAWTIVLEPDGHQGLQFMAGQFAWLKAKTSAFSFRDNPFSFSSSAEQKPRFSFTIKELGDFTQAVGQLETGEKVYVDGSYGTFDIDKHDAPGYVMIAGGVGSVPVLSILRTMADRGDRRMVVFFYGNPKWGGVTFRDDLVDLQKRMDLHMVHVLEQPPEGWQGESGFVTADVLRRHLPEDYKDFRYFICGPIPMINAVENGLRTLGVSMRHVHSENYEMA